MQEADVLKLDKLLIEPNDCPLSAPLNITMQYTLLQPAPSATWHIVYEADTTNKQKLIELYSSSAPTDLPAGTHTFTHTLPEIKTDGVKEKYLLQVGVMKLTLRSKDEGVAVVNMVTQVSKGADGQLIRSIMNPAEE